MTAPFETKDAWAGAFGDAYTERNRTTPGWLAKVEAMWREFLPAMQPEPVRRVLEVGANVGNNLRVLAKLTDAELFALEPNEKARAILNRDAVLPAANILAGTADEIALSGSAVDLVFTCGVLIHVAPDQLDAAYREMHRVSSRYILTAEYFADQPEEKRYRGHDGLLFKRDFGGHWLDLFPDLELMDYGFLWRRTTGLDNLTWWLFRKP